MGTTAVKTTAILKTINSAKPLGRPPPKTAGDFLH